MLAKLHTFSLLGIDALPRVAPTFGRLSVAIDERRRPNVGAAQPCEVKCVGLWRKRTDNRPWRA